MAKLWQKSYTLNALMEAFTVGDDPVLDMRIVNADCVASMAHARMLASIHVLSEKELASVQGALADVISRAAKGQFHIRREDEDVHTALENALVQSVGDAGKRIHAGRSRNDQVLTAVRLWSRGFLFTFMKSGLALAASFLSFAEKHSDVPMPGRTHTQVAMPSSVGLWAAAFAEELLDDLRLARTAFEISDCCPLGSAASYGVPLPLNREMVAELLGFSRVQNNVLYANNSRGKFESITLDAVEQAAITLSKVAQDLILFSLPELGYFTLPAELCTGSSIMPQKKNPDGLELVRAKSASISGDAMALRSIIRSLPSGYNRDFQETKRPLISGCESGLACMRVMELTVENLQVNPDKLLAAFTPGIFAADKALEMVATGMPFREAYQKVSSSLDSLEAGDPVAAVKGKLSTGNTGNLRLDVPRAALDAFSAWLHGEETRKRSSIARLAGSDVELFRDPLGV